MRLVVTTACTMASSSSAVSFQLAESHHDMTTRGEFNNETRLGYVSESSWTYSVYFVQCPRFKWFWGKPTILTSSIPNNKSSLTTNTTKKCYMEWSMAAQEKGDRQNSISKLFCPLAPSCAARQNNGTVYCDTD